jgi:hypothetical protein
MVGPNCMLQTNLPYHFNLNPIDYLTGRSGIDSRRGLDIFLWFTASRLTLRPTQHPILWVPGALSPGVKRLGRGADHSPPSSAKIKNDEAKPPHPIHLRGVLLNELRAESTYYYLTLWTLYDVTECVLHTNLQPVTQRFNINLLHRAYVNIMLAMFSNKIWGYHSSAFEEFCFVW